jgi:hypothetical protein
LEERERVLRAVVVVILEEGEQVVDDSYLKRHL